MVQLVSVLTVIASVMGANAFTISAWESPNYSGRLFQTSGTGTFYTGFTAKSYIWDSPPDDGCCIKFCDGGRETGYWCPARRNPNVAPENWFNKVVTGCGSDVLNC